MYTQDRIVNLLCFIEILSTMLVFDIIYSAISNYPCSMLTKWNNSSMNYPWIVTSDPVKLIIRQHSAQLTAVCTRRHCTEKSMKCQFTQPLYSNFG